MAADATRWLARALAAILPGVILGSAYVALDGYQAEERDSTPKQWDRLLRERKPRVVLFGNSIARRDVDLQILANTLGLKKERMALLTVPDSGGSLWYAALKNRVVAHDHEPDLVLVVGDLGAMLGTTPVTEEDERELIAQLSGDEPVLRRKVFGGTNSSWLRLQQHRGDVRAAALGGLRDGLVGALFAESGNPWVQGRAEARPALDRVFGQDQVDWDLHGRVIPVVELPEDWATYEHPAPSASLIPETCELGRQIGANVVFVRTPLSPDNRDDDHPPWVERTVVQLLNELGCGYLDLRGLDLRDRHFDDPIHMNPAGATLFTTAVARSLLEANTLEAAEFPKAIVPVAPTSLVREGDPPPLPTLSPPIPEDGCRFRIDVPELASLSDRALAAAGVPGASPFEIVGGSKRLTAGDPGTTCDGTYRHAGDGFVFAPERKADADDVRWSLAHRMELPARTPTGREVVWAYPGTTLRWVFDDPWQGPDDSFEIRLVGERFGGGVAAPKLVVDDSEPMALEAEDARYKIAVEQDPPTTRWTLLLEVPQDGPYFLVQGLSVGRGFGSSTVVGTLEDNRGSAVRLVGGVSNSVVDRAAAPEYPLPPPPLKGADAYRRSGRASARFDVPKYAFLTDAETHRLVPYPTMCSPLSVVENGELLPIPHVPCGEVQVKGHGRQCHDQDHVTFTSVDGSDPIANGHEYALVLNPDRQCNRAWWLYPGDRFTLVPRAEDLTRFRDGISQVELDLIPFSGVNEPWTAHVRFLADGKPRVDETLTPASFSQGASRWAIDPPLPPGTTDLRFEVRSHAEHSFLLVSMLSVSEFTDFGPGRKAGTGPLPFLVRRVGAPPELPQRDAWRRWERMDSPCGWRFVLGYPYVSDKDLYDEGLGRASPLRMFEDGVPMKPHASVKEFQGSCSSAFGHTGPFVWFSPAGAPENAEKHHYEVRLAEEVPVPRVGGDPLYWVYPGTELQFEFEGWNPAWGDRELVLQVREFRGTDVSGSGSVRVEDRVTTLARTDYDRVTIPERVKADGPWSLSVASPADGPFLLVDHIGVGSAEQRTRLLGRYGKPKPRDMGVEELP